MADGGMKKFIIIGNQNEIPCKGIFELIKENKLWLGMNSVKEFVKPNGETQKFGNICWYTNVEHKKRHTPLDLYKRYSNEYQKYDNFDAIKIETTSDIPMNYEGIMGVPITFLTKYCPEQFEILDLINRYMIYDYFGVNEIVREKHSHCGSVNGKPVYCRILIRKRSAK